jgi:hypothetical protein
VEVRDGVIRRVWIHRPDEFGPDLWLYLPDAEGRGTPTLAWNDHDMAVVEDCNSGAPIVP